jgi:anthranilate synthase component 2/para-aminobenzoate synthetase component 2
MILIIDNYDSFVHNLARYVREAGGRPLIVRNDAATVSQLLREKPAGVIFSPGPKAPKDAGVSLELLSRLSRATPVLGVCLGHQCLIESAGGRTRRAERPLHGEASLIRHDGTGLLDALPVPFPAGRYHSLVGDLGGASGLLVNAWSEEGEIMGVRSLDGRRHGVQFHPESLLTPDGRRIVEAFLSLTRAEASA